MLVRAPWWTFPRYRLVFRRHGHWNNCPTKEIAMLARGPWWTFPKRYRLVFQRQHVSRR